MTTPLKLIRPDEIKIRWDKRRDPHEVTASIGIYHRLQVSSRELSLARHDLQAYAEDVARKSVMLRIYPKELILELRGVLHELEMRTKRSEFAPDPFTEIRGRLSAILGQLNP